MNHEKAKLKMLTLNEVGNSFDDMKDSVTKEVSEWSGAKRALKDAAKNVTALMAHVEKDIEEGLVPTDGDVLTTAAYVKKYITRCANVVENMMLSAQNMELVANGKLVALDNVLKVTKKKFDEEVANVELYEKGISLGVAPEDIGRPDNNAAADLQQRKEEQKAAKKKRSRGKNS